MVNKIQITYAFIRYIRFQIKKIDQKIKILMSISSLFDPLILPFCNVKKKADRHVYLF